MGQKGTTARKLRAAILDFCVFALLLAGLNALLASDDPLFLGANPNPWLLLPVYLGCRYGFSAGFVSGITIAAVAAAMIAGNSGLPVQTALLDQRYSLLGFLVGGILTGAVRTLLNRQLLVLESRATAAEEENVRLHSDNHVLDEARHQLQQRLALLGAETCGVDQQLRTLFAPAAGPVLPSCLNLLRNAAQVYSSCVVELTEAGGKVIAALDSHWKPGDGIASGELAIARKAVEEGATVTWKADMGNEDNRIIAAVPWSASRNSKVMVLIEDMPFTAVNHSAFVRIEVLVRWVARFLPDPANLEKSTSSQSATSMSRQFVSAEEFESHSKLAQETYDRLGLSSVIAEFEDSGKESSVLEVLKAALQEHLCAPRVACITSDAGKLRVLLPMEGVRDAEVFATALQQPLEAAGKIPAGRIGHQLREIGSRRAAEDK